MGVHSLDYTKDLKVVTCDLLEYADNPKAFAQLTESQGGSRVPVWGNSQALIASGYHLIL